MSDHRRDATGAVVGRFDGAGRERGPTVGDARAGSVVAGRRRCGRRRLGTMQVRLARVLVVAVACLTAGATCMWFSLPAEADAAPPTTFQAVRPLLPRVPARKAPHATLGPDASPTRVDVKFREGSGLRLAAAAVAGGRASDAGEVRGALAGGGGGRAGRRVPEPGAGVTADRERAEARSGRRQADLNLWYRVTVPSGTDTAAFIDRL